MATSKERSKENATAGKRMQWLIAKCNSSNNNNNNNSSKSNKEQQQQHGNTLQVKTK